MATYSSEEQSLSGANKEKELTSVLPADQSVENGEVGKQHHAGEDVDLPSPRKVHGISVRKTFSPFQSAGHERLWRM